MSDFLVRLFVKDPENISNPTVRLAYGRLCGFTGIFCNLVLVAAKLVAAFLSGSIAIMADAINNFSDAASALITLAGFKLASRPADRYHPFGYARFEYIAGLAVSLMVMAIGINLGKASIDKIVHPTPVDFGPASLFILGGSILLKLWLAFFNRKIGRKIGSGALIATYTDSRNDVLSTSAVLVAGIIARFTRLDLDGYMCFAVAVFILISGIRLVRDTLSPLLGTAPDPDLVRHIAEKIADYPNVLGTHDLMVHDYGPGRNFASAHVEMSAAVDVLESHDVIDDIEWDFLTNDNLYLILHYDPVDTNNHTLNPARNRALAVVQAIDPRLTLHDFRQVSGQKHDNYIFDVLAPEDFPISDQQLKKRINDCLQGGERPVHTHVTVDTSYSPIPR